MRESLMHVPVVLARGLAAVALVGGTALSPATILSTAAAPSTCQFSTPTGAVSPIQHVVHIQFDNVHFRRDIDSVPSDLEQMPHLLNFIQSQGVLFANEHTPLISHTAYDLIAGMTGLYADQLGIPTSNSFEVYNSSQVGTYNTSVFTYWTDRIAPDPANAARVLPIEMLNSSGQNVQAPWVPFVKAGCNFGAVSTANLVLENNGSDINQVFGPGSPEASEPAAQRTSDFVGVAVHCADATCSTVGNGSGTNAKPELGGQGFAALYGHKYVATQVGSITQTDGTPITGFGGFSPNSRYTLGYLASLLKAGVPVVYGYIADAHDSRVSCAPTSPTNPVVQDTINGQACGAFAPGEPGYVDQLRDWDLGFQQFFDQLNAAGINSSNTLFVFHSDENDHYSGLPPTNPGCDGISTPCHYDRTAIGEVSTDLPLLLKQQGLYDFGMFGGTGATPGTPRPGFTNTDLPYAIDFDTAPGFWLKGHPGNASSPVRKLENALVNATAPNPLLGPGTDKLFRFYVDVPGMQALHMVTADPDRNQSVTGFAQEDHFLQTSPLIGSSGTSSCNRFPSTTDATCLSSAFIWQHGDFAPDIVTTWAAMVGPGVVNRGVDSRTWADHADLRPSMMTLLCLKDGYTHQGRALFEDLSDSAVPAGVAANRDSLGAVARTFKRLNAPVGQFGRGAIQINTTAIQSDDATYAALESKLTRLVNKRDALVAQVAPLLDQMPGCQGYSAADVASFNQITANERALMVLMQQNRGTQNPDDEGFTDV